MGWKCSASRRKSWRVYRPVVMRGLVAEWPAVQRAKESIEIADAVPERIRQRPRRRCDPHASQRTGADLLQRRHERFQLHPREGVDLGSARSHGKVGSLREAAGSRGAKRAHLRLPAGLRREASDAAAGRLRRAAHLAWQLGHHARAFRRVGQHRVRRGRHAAVHALSAGTGAQPLHRSHRQRADGHAHQPRGIRESRFRALPQVSRGARCRVGRRVGAGRRAVYPAALVAPRRVARTVQHAGELLVEGQARGSGASGLGAGRAAAQPDQPARAAARAARCVAHDLRSLCLFRGRDHGAPHSGIQARRAGADVAGVRRVGEGFPRSRS